jgi:hypothetical protein
MAFTEDLDLFLADFGVQVTAGAVSGLGIMDMPSEIVADGVVLTTDYKLTCKTTLFGGLVYGDTVAVDGVNYTVREVMRLDDGAFCDLMLMRIPPDGTVVGRNPREFELQDLTDVSIANQAQGDLLINDGTDWVNTPNIDGGTP